MIDLLPNEVLCKVVNALSGDRQALGAFRSTCRFAVEVSLWACAERSVAVLDGVAHLGGNLRSLHLKEIVKVRRGLDGRRTHDRFLCVRETCLLEDLSAGWMRTVLSCTITCFCGCRRSSTSM